VNNHADQQNEPCEPATADLLWHAGWSWGFDRVNLSKVLWLLGTEYGVLAEWQYQELITGYESGQSDRTGFERDQAERDWYAQPEPTTGGEIPF